MLGIPLIPISHLTLSSLFPVGTDVYLRPKGAKEAMLFLAADQIATEEALELLAVSKDIKLFISQTECQKFQKHLRDNFDLWFENDAVPAKNKAAMLSEVIRNVLSDEFTRNDTNSIVDATKQLGVHIARLATEKSLTGAELCQILHHDYGTFTHSGNVAFYCSLLAAELGYANEELAEIATGGLLHDLGKLDIDERVLNKPGKLDEFEFRIIKEHPLGGFRRLTKVNEATRIQLLMTYQHHERIDGKGYPVGIGGDEIHIASRICSVADVFEAMTSNRPYRGALSHKQTLEIMTESVTQAFDKEVFECWKTIVSSRLGN